MKNYYWPVVCFSLLLMAGCAASPARDHEQKAPAQEQATSPTAPPAMECPSAATTTPQVVSREDLAEEELLVYAKHFGELSAEKQSKELVRVMQSLSRDKKNVRNRLKAALVLSLPENRQRDYERALALLTELQREKGLDQSHDALASLLKSHVEERQRLEGNALGLGQKLKEEQQRADELQKKLDDLKKIEKTMIERSRGAQP